MTSKQPHDTHNWTESLTNCCSLYMYEREKKVTQNTCEQFIVYYVLELTNVQLRVSYRVLSWGEEGNQWSVTATDIHIVGKTWGRSFPGLSQGFPLCMSLCTVNNIIRFMNTNNCAITVFFWWILRILRFPNSESTNCTMTLDCDSLLTFLTLVQKQHNG